MSPSGLARHFLRSSLEQTLADHTELFICKTTQRYIELRNKLWDFELKTLLENGIGGYVVNIKAIIKELRQTIVGSTA